MIDHDGKPTTNPGTLFEPVDGRTGALTTMAAHKGYALAMVCELLGAALTGGRVTIPKNQPKAGVWNNMLTIVFDPTRFGTQGPFEQATHDFVDWVKSARLADGFDEIMMPGDPERKSRKARADAVPIDEGTIAEMDQAAATIAALHDGRGPGALSVMMRAAV